MLSQIIPAPKTGIFKENPTQYFTESVYAILLLWPLILGLFTLQSLSFMDYTNDDAFISFRYAQNLAHGYGLVFNPGQKVEGYTNFLWVLIFTPIIKLGLNPEIFAKILGLGFYSLIHFVLILSNCPKLSELKTKYLIYSLLLVSYSSAVIWALSGLESAAFSLFITVPILMIWNQPLAKLEAIFYGFLSGLASLVRPEGLIFTITLFVFLIFKASRNKKDFPIPILFLSSALILIIPHFIFRLSYYGWLFPNTYYLRMGHGFSQLMQQIISGLNYLIKFISVHPEILLPILALAVKTFRIKFTSLGLIILPYILMIIYVGGDEKPYFRLFVPVLPILTLLTAEAIFVLFDKIFSEGQKVKNHKKQKQIFITIVLIVIISHNLLYGLGIIKNSDFSRMRYESKVLLPQRIQLANWLKENALPDSTLAIWAAGAVPYYSGLVTYDILGVNDAYIAHQPFNTEGGVAHHQKKDLSYTLSLKPTFVNENCNLSNFIESYGYERLDLPFEVPFGDCLWKLK